MKRVLVIADTQNPFDHTDYLPFLKAVERKYRTNTTIHVGDEVDLHALSDYKADPDGMSAGDELQAAIKSLKPYYQAFPNVKVCESNHTERIFKRAFNSGIPTSFLRDYREFLKAPKGWQWAKSWEIDGVVYQHGIGYSGRNGAINAAVDNTKSTVIGHLHAHAGIQYTANEERLIFGANAGCGINRHTYAFKYAKYARNKPILSCLVVLEGVPHLIPMLIGKNHRWVGKL